jgi:hypothetical protein
MRRLSFAGANGEARMMRAALLSVIGVLLLGAAAHAQPYIYHGNDTGGIIPWSCENEAMAQQLAAAYCARWDKYHRITSVHRQYGDFIAFSCLWSPYINPYALPAVPTRYSCYYPPARPLIINK